MATVLTIAAAVVILSVVLNVVGANSWVWLAVIAVVLMIGLVVLWRLAPLIGENRSAVKSRRIAVAIVVTMAFSLLIFTVVLGSVGANNWALPVFLAVDAVVLAVGLVSMWRAREH